MNFLNKSNFVNNQKHAIIQFDEKNVLTSLTYSEMQDICQIIENNLKIQDCFVGLFMDKNVFLPCLIISLKRLNCPFCFLTDENCHNLIDGLQIKYIISMEEKAQITFKITKKIHVNPQLTLTIQQNDMTIDTKVITPIFCAMTTTGTTGESKIIKIPVQCIEDNSTSLTKILNITSEDIIFWGTPLTFDPNLIEFLMTVEKQATLFIVSKKVHLNLNLLYKALFTHKTEIYKGITVLQMVPSIFNRWPPSLIKEILNSQLRILMFGGEIFPETILNYPRKSDLQLYNLYGITELSCWATIAKIDHEITLGECIGDTIIKITTNGEALIGSTNRFCLINNEETPITSLFRVTGDIIEQTEKGLVYKGRTNNTIKRFGHKINLTKIDQIISQELNLNSTTISTDKLTTFIQIGEVFDKPRTIDKIRVKLMKILPREMTPDRVEILEKFPVNKHGKIDRKILENWNFSGGLLGVLCGFLGLSVEQLKGLGDYTFFDVGGNSITATQILNEVHEKDRSKITEYLFESPLKDLLNAIESLDTRKRRNEDFRENSAPKIIKSGINIVENWRYDLGACVDATPLIFEYKGNFYVAIGSFSTKFAVLNLGGEKILEIILGDNIEGTAVFSRKYCLLLIGCFDGNFYAIDFDKKLISWTFKCLDRIKSKPCLCLNEEAVIFGCYDKNVYCLSLTGGIIWRTNLGESLASNALLDEIGQIYLTSIKGGCFCISETTGEILWYKKLRAPIFGSPVYFGGDILVATVDGAVFCLSKQGELTWSFEVQGNVFSTIEVTENSFYVTCHDCHLYKISVNEETPKLSYKINVGASISAKAAILMHNNKKIVILITVKGLVNLIDEQTGILLSEFKLPGDVFSSPVVCNDKIIVGCRDNNLYCLRLINYVI